MGINLQKSFCHELCQVLEKHIFDKIKVAIHSYD
jgi:hypothetical protein